jgi:NAD(P)H dehydrogenase (quinone)
MSETLLITGAAGQLGQRVISHLLDAHAVVPARIVAATRNPEKLSALASRGVEVRKADFEDVASLDAAFTGVDRVLLISTDAIDRPGRRLAQHKAALEAAKKEGVKHVVYTSMPNPDDSLVTFAPDHLGTEQALTSSGLGWTILRNSWYMDNLLMSLPAVLASGKWFTSTGNGKAAHVSRDDCARAAAAVLASTSIDNARYDITGPQKHTVAQIAAQVSEVSGKPIEVIQVSDEQLAEGMQAAGLPAFVATLLTSFDANTRAGKVDLLTNAVEQLTGKSPQTLRDFLIANQAALKGHSRH